MYLAASAGRAAGSVSSRSRQVQPVL